MPLVNLFHAFPAMHATVPMMALHSMINIPNNGKLLLVLFFARQINPQPCSLFWLIHMQYASGIFFKTNTDTICRFDWDWVNGTHCPRVPCTMSTGTIAMQLQTQQLIMFFLIQANR